LKGATSTSPTRNAQPGGQISRCTVGTALAPPGSRDSRAIRAPPLPRFLTSLRTPGTQPRFRARTWHGSPLAYPPAAVANRVTCGNTRDTLAGGAFPGTQPLICARGWHGSPLAYPPAARIATCVPAAARIATCAPAPASTQSGGFPRPAVQCSPRLNCTRGRGW